jgi:probable phosphoglycerate mutase
MKIKIKSTTTTLLLFRHGETDWNIQERFQGHTDIPLNDRGREQARALIPEFRENSVEAIFSSDLSRAHDTGKIIADALGIPIFTDSGLRESYLGDAQGLTREEIEAKFGIALAVRWRSSRVSDADVSYPGGESGAQIIARVFGALESWILAHPYTYLGIATHGGVIRRIMQKLCPPDSPPVPIPNGIVYRIFFNHAERRFYLAE